MNLASALSAANIMRSIKRFCILPVFVTFIVSNMYSQTMVYNINLTPIAELPMFLRAGSSVVIETRNLSAGSDPVLNLLSPEGVEVAANDNAGNGLAARITFNVVANGSYTLIVRAKNNSSGGTADIVMNDVTQASNVPFGGWQQELQRLRLNETVETVKLPLGAGGTHRIYFLKPDRIGISRRVSGGGVDNGALYRSPSTVQSARILAGSDGQSGQVRVVRNDAAIAGHDIDGDGLGDEVEREIGTCTKLSGAAGNFDCSLATDARDTDGDGLSDRIEFMGKRTESGGFPLPKWGASPRHKDMFIEIDFMRRSGVENANNTILKMTPDVARHFARVYGDSGTTSALVKLYHASVLRNPDQVPGISVHLDIGVAPELPGDVTIYGNWGGYNAVNALKKDGSPCGSSTSEDDCQGVAAGTSNDAWHDEAWRTNMNAERLGVFRYALGYAGGGGSAGKGFAAAFNFHSRAITNHEWGHTFGLGHNGLYGGEDIDVNCKTNYPSIMNYAFYSQFEAGFSDGRNIGPLNNSALKEWKAVPASNKFYMTILRTEFNYNVDTLQGHVDWNRDGVFAPEGQTVRAYANFRPDNACEFTKYNQLIVGNAQTTGTPVLARLSNRLYIFYVRDGAVKYRYSTSTWNCAEPSDAACGSWGAEKDAGITAIGVDVLKKDNQLLIVCTTWPGDIKEKRLTLVSNIENWSVAATIPGKAAGEPSLAIMPGGVVYLAYKGTDLNIHYNKLVSGSWQPSETAMSNTNEPIRSTTLWAFPALTATYLPWRPGVKALYGLFPDRDGFLDIWHFDVATSRWQKTDVLEGRPGPIHGRPGTAWVPARTANQYPGKFYLLYSKQSSGGVFKGDTRFRMSYVALTRNADGTERRTEKVGIDSYFQNSWYHSYGNSLFYEPGVDGNLRALCVLPGDDQSFSVWFRPLADGIVNFTYRNHNDWDVLRLNLCQLVVNPGNLISNPILCDQN